MIEGGSRVNSVQIFWSFIIIYIVFTKINTKIKYPLLLIYALSMIAFSVHSFSKWQYDDSLIFDQAKSLISFAGQSLNNEVVVAGILSFVIPYQVHYCKYNDFGRENIEVLPVSFNYLIGPAESDKKVRMINCNYYKNDLVISKIADNVVLSIDLNNLKYSSFIKNKNKSPIRGYDTIGFNLEPSYRFSFKKLMYYDGLTWNWINK